MATITGCKVTRKVDKAEVDVITSPTSAELNDDGAPTMNIVVTGGTRVADRLKKNFGGYIIKGTVDKIGRDFPLLKCEDASDPAKFKQ
jgi:hypothetical protein